MADAVGPKRSAATRGELVLQTGLMHRFLQQINVKLTTGFAGTDNEPVLVSMLQPLHVNWCLCSNWQQHVCTTRQKSCRVGACHSPVHALDFSSKLCVTINCPAVRGASVTFIACCVKLAVSCKGLQPGCTALKVCACHAGSTMHGPADKPRKFDSPPCHACCTAPLLQPGCTLLTTCIVMLAVLHTSCRCCTCSHRMRRSA